MKKEAAQRRARRDAAYARLRDKLGLLGGTRHIETKNAGMLVVYGDGMWLSASAVECLLAQLEALCPTCPTASSSS